MANLDWSKSSAVESIPGNVSGAWVLRSTRIPVSAIFENIEAGAIIDHNMEWFAVRSLDKAPAYASWMKILFEVDIPS